MSRDGRAVAGSAVLLALVVTAAHPVIAQRVPPTGSVLITVLDSSGAGIIDAEVRVEGSAVHGVTDETGKVRLTAVPIGPVRLGVRRLGFRPASVEVAVNADSPATASVTLAAVGHRLAPIFVRGAATRLTGPMAEFYERRDRGLGRFITRAELERDRPHLLTDVFRRIPGIQIVSTEMIPNAIRMRGMRCAPLVWLDGSPAAAAEFDLDAIPPESVEGIEVYRGVSEVPPQFIGPHGLGTCGVVVVWSRSGERRETPERRTVTAAELAERVLAREVYTAEEVDTPARPADSAGVRPAYPEWLLLEGVGGRVVAEYVVDTTGRVLMDTFGVISSTHPSFAAAVRSALVDVVYVPAVLLGRRVKQIIQQPFTFVADSAVLPRRPR